jgi:hypothetical protein
MIKIRGPRIPPVSIRFTYPYTRVVGTPFGRRRPVLKGNRVGARIVDTRQSRVSGRSVRGT